MYSILFSTLQNIRFKFKYYLNKKKEYLLETKYTIRKQNMIITPIIVLFIFLSQRISMNSKNNNNNNFNCICLKKMYYL